MTARYTGRCDCGSVLDGTVDGLTREGIDAWKDRHVRGLTRLHPVRGEELVPTGHTLVEDRTWEDQGRALSEEELERVRSGVGLERPVRRWRQR